MIFTGHVLYVKYFKYFILDLSPKGWYPDPHAPDEEIDSERSSSLPKATQRMSRAEVEAGVPWDSIQGSETTSHRLLRSGCLQGWLSRDIRPRFLNLLHIAPSCL